MPHRITIRPSGHVFNASENETILDAALKQSYVLPYGCRNGACGSCKGKILEGEIDFGNYHPGALSESEKTGGWALFCQVKPLSDLIIQCREISVAKDIQVKTLPARVQKLEKLAPDVMRILLKLPANERLQFLPGQYIDILLKDGRRRSLSLANGPSDEFLELHMRRVNGGYFSEQVFTQMKERDILRIHGPLGTFFVRENHSKPALFLAGGTGFAPIKSMIQHELQTGGRRELILYWGVRSRVDLYLGNVPEQWTHLHKNFHFIPVLSDPLSGDGWTGRNGLVHRALMEDFPDLSGFQTYVCGAPTMIDVAKKEFIQNCRLASENFFSDAFTYSSN